MANVQRAGPNFHPWHLIQHYRFAEAVPKLTDAEMSHVTLPDHSEWEIQEFVKQNNIYKGIFSISQYQKFNYVVTKNTRHQG